MFAYNLALNHASDYFTDGNVEILAMSKKLSEYLILKQINHDMILCFASFFFIWLYVAVHLQSIFLSSVSMMNIALSIPMGLVIYKMLIPFFCLLHILVVLIILGIGADNTFLFNDTWKASG